jgi:cellulose synthase/poly-beta-1,6-N-acetylglucosamine synthase-like glycosyltransferase
MNVSVVIPCGRPDRISALAASLAAQTQPPHEILVVCAVAVPAVDGLRLVSVPTLYPPGRMRNIGAAVASGDVLLFLDDDCIPPPNWINDLLAVMESDARIAAVGCKLVSAHPGFWNRCADFALFWPYQYDQRSDTALGSATLAVRRNAYQKVGGFDETLLATEDWDFCLKLHEQGWRSVHEPGVSVRHDHRRGTLGAILMQAWTSGLLSGLVVQRRHLGRMSGLARLSVAMGNPWLYWLMILPSAGLIALLQVLPFIRSEPRVLLFSPIVFLGRLFYQCGVWRNLEQSK